MSPSLRLVRTGLFTAALLGGLSSAHALNPQPEPPGMPVGNLLHRITDAQILRVRIQNTNVRYNAYPIVSWYDTAGRLVRTDRRTVAPSTTEVFEISGAGGYIPVVSLGVSNLSQNIAPSVQLYNARTMVNDSFVTLPAMSRLP